MWIQSSSVFSQFQVLMALRFGALPEQNAGMGTEGKTILVWKKL